MLLKFKLKTDTENLAPKKRKSSLLNRESISKSERRQSKAFTMTHEDTEFINSLKQNEKNESVPPPCPATEEDFIENEFENQLSKRSKTTHSNSVEAKRNPPSKETVQNVSQTPTRRRTASKSIEQAIEPFNSLIIETNTPNAPTKPNSIFKTKQPTPKKTENDTKQQPKELQSKSKSQLEGVSNYMNEFFEEAAKSDPKATSSLAKKVPQQSKINQLKEKPPPMPGSRPPRPPTNNTSHHPETKNPIQQKRSQIPTKHDSIQTSQNLINNESATISKNLNDSIPTEEKTPLKEKKSRSISRSVRSISSTSDSNSSTVNKENNNSLHLNDRNSVSGTSLNILEQPLSENTRRSRTLVNYKEPTLNS